MNTSLLSIIREGLLGTTASLVFTCCIAGFFIFSLYIALFFKKDKFSFIMEFSPSLLTMLGLFGTFWGVAQGLGTFEVQNIEKSIPELLDGMKLAFWTSILGMLGALILNLIKFAMGVSQKENVEGDISASDIYKVMMEQKSAILDSTALISDMRMEIHSISNERNSILKDNFKNIIDEFREFAAKMAENNSKALIEALKEVITDFNTKINEQFGENFKELNHAVGALLQWQENYREHIESIVSHFELALAGIEKSRIAIEDINKNTTSIPATMEILRSLMEKLDYEVTKAQELLGGFVALRTKADEVFPIIKQSIDHLTQDFSQSVINSTNRVETTVTNQSRTMEVLAKQVAEQAINSDSIMRKGLEEIHGVFKKTLDDIEESTKKHYESLDKQLEVELQRAIGVLGSKLASLYSKLISDYTTLVSKIDNLVSRTSQDK